MYGNVGDVITQKLVLLSSELQGQWQSDRH
jgi:hypothetical protein